MQVGRRAAACTAIRSRMLTCEAAEVVDARLVVHCKHTSQALRPPLEALLLVRLDVQANVSKGLHRGSTGLSVLYDSPTDSYFSQQQAEINRTMSLLTFQSNSGLPHSWPVSEKASGGTPETCAGAPAAANNSTCLLEAPTTQGQHGGILTNDRDLGAGVQQDRDASTDIGFDELTCQLEQMLAGPHICRLRTHIDGHVAHDVDPICICVRLQVAVVMTEICRSPHR